MRILLAVDGSDQSYDAVRALSHMGRSDAMVLLHVVDVPAQAYPMMAPEVTGDLYTTQERAMREEGERVVRTAMSLLPWQKEVLTRRMMSDTRLARLIAGRGLMFSYIKAVASWL